GRRTRSGGWAGRWMPSPRGTAWTASSRRSTRGGRHLLQVTRHLDRAVRLRRLRRTDTMRELVRETRLHPHQFVYPMFVRGGRHVREPIPSMPGQFRLSVDEAVADADSLRGLGINAVPPVVPSIIGHPVFLWGPPGAAHRAPVTMRPMRRRESRLPLCIVYRLSDRVSSALVESGLVARAFAPRPGRASRVPSRLLGFEHDRMGVASQRAVGR